MTKAIVGSGWQEAADSLARAAANGDTWPGWRLIAAGVVVTAALLVVGLFVVHFLAIRKAGGLKPYSADLNTVNYGTVRGIYVSETVLGGFAVTAILHAVVPKLVSELQTEIVLILITGAFSLRGIDFGKFWAKRATEDPVIAATNAAIREPGVMPTVTSNKKTGETTVTAVPIPVPTVTTEVTKTIDGASVTTKRTETAESFAPPEVKPEPPKPEVKPAPKKHAPRDD